MRICKNCQGPVTPCFLFEDCEHCCVPLDRVKLYTAYCNMASNKRVVLFPDMKSLNFYVKFYDLDKRIFKVAAFFDFSAFFTSPDSGDFVGTTFSKHSFNLVDTHKCAAIREKSDDFAFILEEILTEPVAISAM